MVYSDLEKEVVLKNEMNIFLYAVVVIVNLGGFTTGAGFTWSSPATLKLGNTPENPFDHPLTEDEMSWLASLIALGAAIGPFAGGYLADKIGRKKTFILTALPSILSYILLIFVPILYIHYIARFIAGICAGIFMTVIPMYVGEVAEIRNRGTLGCFTLFFVTIGALYSYAIGPYISLQWFNISILLSPILSLILVVLFVPESPSYLLMIGKHDFARRMLRKLRKGCIENELVDITTTVKESTASKGGIIDIWRNRNLKNALFVSSSLMFILQMTAISIITFYLQLIFEGAGTSVSPEISAIIVGAMQVVGTFASILVVEKLGRRPMLLASTIITSLTLYIFSIYLYLLTIVDVSIVGWLPIVTLMVYIFSYNVGIGPLSFAVMGEIFPPHVKSIASSLTVSVCYIFCFATTKIFPLLVAVGGNWFAFLVFAVLNSLGILFIWKYVPETKGKTLAEILENFK